MIKLESLKKNNYFKLVLKEKKVHTNFFSIFAAKNFYIKKNKNILNISFVMKKKIGNAVKRNRIRRKLKAIVHRLLKIKGAINSNYTYIVFGKSKAYEKDHKILFSRWPPSIDHSSGVISNFLILIISFLIKFYNFFISPLLGVKCRFLPTCSEYCNDSLKVHGLIKGGAYSLRRIIRCHPIKILGGEDGIDLVPKKNHKSKELN